MNKRKILIGCGLSVLIAILFGCLLINLGWSAFLEYGIGTDLSEYRGQLQKIEMDPEVKTSLLTDLDRIRASLDEKNNIRFFKWIEIDESIIGILDDGKIDEDELVSLRADIQRLKKMQHLD